MSDAELDQARAEAVAVAARAMKENDRLRAGLRRLEWAGYRDGWCPVCNGMSCIDGHKPDCWLAELLRELP